MTKPVQQRQPKDSRHGAEDRPKGWAIGAVLRETREQLGYTLEDVSENINIRTQQLEAIENAEFDKLPGMTYAIGFIRSYAKLLDLDAENLVRHYKDEFGTVDTKPDLDAPADATESQVPGPLLVGGAALLALIVLVLWVVFSSGEEDVVEIPDVPAELASDAVKLPDVASPVLGDTQNLPPAIAGAELAITAESGSPAPEDTGPAMVQPESAIPESEDFGRELSQVHPAVPPRPPVAHSRDVSVVLPGAVITAAQIEGDTSNLQQAPATQAASTPAATPRAQSQNGTARIASRVTLVANRTSWVEIYESGGAILMTRVMKKGERYLVPDRKGILLTTGNAGALDVLVDGKNIGPVGKDGDVMRGVELEAGKLLKH